MNQELIEQAKAKVAECIALAQKHLPNRQLKIPELEFSLKGLTAGYAFSGDKINLNYDLLASDTYDMINDTIPHEVAHIVAFQVYGSMIKPHGQEWRVCCSWVGHPKGYYADRTHNYDTKSAQNRKKFLYSCPSCRIDFEIGLNVHNKILNGQKRICNRCKSEIVFKQSLVQNIVIEKSSDILTGFNPFK